MQAGREQGVTLADREAGSEQGVTLADRVAGRQTENREWEHLLCHAPLSFHERPVFLIHHEVDEDSAGDEHNFSVARVQEGHHHGVHCVHTNTVTVQ